MIVEDCRFFESRWFLTGVEVVQGVVSCFGFLFEV